MEESFLNKLANPENVINNLNQYSTDEKLNDQYNNYTVPFRNLMLGLLGLNTLLCIGLKYHIQSFRKDKHIKYSRETKLDKSEAKAAMMKKRPNSLLIMAIFTIPNIILIGAIFRNTKQRRDIEDQMINKTKYDFLNFIDLFKEDENNKIINK